MPKAACVPCGTDKPLKGQEQRRELKGGKCDGLKEDVSRVHGQEEGELTISNIFLRNVL